MYLLLVTALLLLYDLLFDITWLFSPHCYYVAHLVMAVIHTHVVMAVISLTFPSLSKLPCSLHIPSRSFEKQIPIPYSPYMGVPRAPGSTGTLLRNVLHSQTMQNLDGLKVLVSSLLSFFLIHFKVRLFQNINLSNLFVSILLLTCVGVALFFLLYWKEVYIICLRQVFKYNTTINCLLEMLLFPAVIILKLFLSLLNPVYNILFHIRPQFKFSLVHHFWGITSKFFLFSLMTVYLFVFHGILLNLGTTPNLVLILL